MSGQRHFTHIPAPEGVIPGAGYIRVVTGTDRLVAVSGQVALNARAEVVGPGDPAASAAVQVAALFRPDLLLEIEVLALVPEP